MARIVLILRGRKTRELLTAWLSQSHSVGEHDSKEPLEEACDLCIVDGPGLQQFRAQLELRRVQEQPGLFPVLLLTPTRDVWSKSPGLAHFIDDAIALPVSKSELLARVEIHLRARRLSLDLKLRNDDLEAFIQAMSHDLRTSIRAVSMFAEVLSSKAGRFSDEDRNDLQRIQNAAAEMRGLIDSLLNLSRLGRGGIGHQAIDLRSHIEDCLKNLHAEIRARNGGVKLKVRKASVQTDPTLLKIALTNLVSNAIKFVPDGTVPEITISAAVCRDVCRIEVRDNGIGIAAEDQQRIFMPFVRLHGEVEYHGIGLGLSSVRKALELIGGRAGVESAPGRGSIFWIEFPPR